MACYTRMYHYRCATQTDRDSDNVTQQITLDPDNPFEAAVLAMVQMHRRKREDYAGDDHPNQNFYDSSYQLGLSAGHSVEQLIATKQARLRVLLPRLWKSRNAKPANESIQDTLLDRAVYSVIALTIWEDGDYVAG